jgi:hypothetical protein
MEKQRETRDPRAWPQNGKFVTGYEVLFFRERGHFSIISYLTLEIEIDHGRVSHVLQAFEDK